MAVLRQVHFSVFFSNMVLNEAQGVIHGHQKELKIHVSHFSRNREFQMVLINVNSFIS